MTFEAMDTCAPETAVEATAAPAARPSRQPARRESPADKMLNFVIEGEAVASQLRGLAALFRAMFFDDEMRRSDDASAAAGLVDDVLNSMATRLETNADRARVTCAHLNTEGGR